MPVPEHEHQWEQHVERPPYYHCIAVEGCEAVGIRRLGRDASGQVTALSPTTIKHHQRERDYRETQRRDLEALRKDEASNMHRPEVLPWYP